MPVDGFVLVHGGYHGAWCWERVHPLLDRPSVAVDLPGRGSRPSLPGEPVTLEQCVEAVISDAERAGLSRFVLVGHSLGGITITETANLHPERVAELVYLAALVLPPGGNAFDLFFPDGGAPDIEDPAGTLPLLEEELAHAMFASDLSSESFAAVQAHCVAEPVGLFNATVSGYSSDIPTSYIRCSRDGALSSELSGQMLERLNPASVFELDADHDVMLSHPAELAALLNRVAARA